MKLKNILRSFIIIIIVISSLASVTKAFYNAQKLSFDFHLSPTKLVADGINHYRYILDGKHDDSPNDVIKYDQNGIYAQGLFVILIPFTFLDWENAKLTWSLINIFISILICLILCKKFKINRINTFFILSIFLTSTVYRIHIAYGQQTLLMFLFLILPFIRMNYINITLSGIAFFKYNIGYGLFLFFLASKKIKYLILSSIPLVIGWLTYCFITETNIVVNLFEPLKVIMYWNNDDSHFPVTIFSLLKLLNFNSYIILILPLLITFFIVKKISKDEDDLKKLSIICLCILGFAPHQLHDYVILLPLLIYSIKNLKEIVSILNLIVIFYFFYFLRVISFFYDFEPWVIPYGFSGYLNNLIIIVILFVNLINLKHIKNRFKKKSYSIN